MRIPGTNEREAFVDDIAMQCLVSRDERIGEYERNRAFYLWGNEGADQPAIFNKILPQIDLLVSFLFAAETTRFGIVVGEGTAKEDIIKVPALARHLNNRWADSNADVQYGQAVTWALVYNTMLMKLVQRGRQTVPYLVDPHNFGVLREDMPFLDDQEAFVHCYTISMGSLRRILGGHPGRDSIMERVIASQKPDTHDMPAGLSRILMSNTPMPAGGGPSGPGQVTNLYGMIDMYRARLADPQVEMREVWMWDDAEDDYRIVTQASGGVTIFDRPNTNKEDSKKSMYLPQEHPFVQVCPNPAYDYFWGHSEVQRLQQLQLNRETRMEQIIELLSRQVKPPVTMKGSWQGIPDEAQYALNVFGAGMMAPGDPMADAKVWYPTVPPDTFTEIRAYDEMFNEMTGLSNVTQGKGESGVRSRGHAAELARLGSSRIRKRAFTLEDGLDKIGTHYLKLAQAYDDAKLIDTEGTKFVASQFTKDAMVRVDGHSSSPIFIEDKRSLALEMLEVHAIDRAEYIEQVDPANKQVLLENLKKIEAAEAKAAEAERAMDAQKAGIRAVK